jgi:NAD(P)-dependent dehydrogenase (short-subunit alcohol dehydrogenase family)
MVDSGSSGRLEGKVAIVTGGGSGIGEAVSRELARRGAQVVVADINADHAERVAAAVVADGGQAQARRVDVSQEQDVRRLIERVVSGGGRLDYQFNNAGINIAGDCRDLTVDHWRRVLDVDLNGVLYGTLAAYEVMTSRGSGHIVNMSSAAGLMPYPLSAPYTTAKHAVVGLSLSLRLEGADLGVKVSVVCPGYVRTPIHQNSQAVGMSRHVLEAVPARAQVVEPDAAARAILDGVQRNQAMIIFPTSVRLAQRLAGLFPRFLDRTQVRQVRDGRQHRTAAAQTGPAAD